MDALATKYPDDHEARIFYALSISASEDPSDKTYAGRLKAGAILEELFKQAAGSSRTGALHHPILTTCHHWHRKRSWPRDVIPKIAPRRSSRAAHALAYFYPHRLLEGVHSDNLAAAAAAKHEKQTSGRTPRQRLRDLCLPSNGAR